MSKEILSISEVIDKLGSKPSPETILAVLIQEDICCFVKRPHVMKVYVATTNHEITFHDTVLFQRSDLPKSMLPYPAEVHDAFLLSVNRNTLKELDLTGEAQAGTFDRVLQSDLTDTRQIAPLRHDCYAIATIDKKIQKSGWHTFTDHISISVSDLLIRGNDFPKLESVYFSLHVRDRLCVAHPKVSILNFASYDFYKNDLSREYRKEVVHSLLSREINGVSLSKLEADRLSTIIRRDTNLKQGAHSKSIIFDEGIKLTEEMNTYRHDCFSDLLVLVNYLALHNFKHRDRRRELNKLAESCGMKSTLSSIVVGMIIGKPSK